MSSSHNNKLNMVSMFDSTTSNMANGWSSIAHGLNMAKQKAADDAKKANADVNKSTIPINMFMMDMYGAVHYQPGEGVKEDSVTEEAGVSCTSTYDSDDGESDFESPRSSRFPSRTPKINKDGAPRKPRQPRPKLLKWSDNDWKNVVLGIIWACGESGVQIPFDQAAQVVGESCTAGAMQQAILKLRQKQVDQGYQIPSLRMAWTRKNKNSSSSSSNANAKSAQPSGPPGGHGDSPVSPCRRSRIVKLKYKHSSKLVEAKNLPLVPKKAAEKGLEVAGAMKIAKTPPVNTYPRNTVPARQEDFQGVYFPHTSFESSVYEQPHRWNPLLDHHSGGGAQGTHELFGVDVAHYPAYMTQEAIEPGLFGQTRFDDVFGNNGLDDDDFGFS
jgi:hypothetical protein